MCDITLLRVGSTNRVCIAAVDAARVVGQQHDLPLAAQAVTLRVNASIAVHVFTTELSYPTCRWIAPSISRAAVKRV